jgi:hypothetical protein
MIVLHATEHFAQALREGRVDWGSARADIFKDFDRATTTSEREFCLGLHKSLMDAVEQTIDPGHIDEFRKTRAQDYRLLLIKEVAVLDRDAETIDPAKLAAITRREVDAGRLSADDELHKLAVSGDTILTPHNAPSGIVAKVRGWLGL